MSYTKKTWSTGDTITAQALNNIEDGVASALTVVKVPFTEIDGNYSLGLTWQQIYDAIADGNIVLAFESWDDGEEKGAECYHICLVDDSVGGFNVYVDGKISDRFAIAQTADGYPVIQ